MAESLTQSNDDIAMFCSAFLPSVEYVMFLNNHTNIVLDHSENWQKQTARNRCFILSPNGIQSLIIPIKHKQGKPIKIKDLRISYDVPWIRVHKGSLQAAYNTSANFEYLKDDLWAFYERKFEFLIDLNQTLLEWLLKKLKIKTTIQVIESHETNMKIDFTKISNASSILPTLLTAEQFKPYPQVFGYKHPFQTNLSSFDLLCNGANINSIF